MKFLFQDVQLSNQLISTDKSVFYQMQVQPSVVTGKRLSEEPENTKTELYEAVISKYFEIIKTILPRISTLYLENQEFQHNMYILSSKMAKIEKDHENLHYEMRANHLSFDNKINHIISEYSNISNEYSHVKQQNQDLYREIKEIKYYQTVQKQSFQDQQEEYANNSQLKKQKPKKITFLQNNNQKQQGSISLIKNKKSLKFFQRKSSINLIEEPGVQPQEDNTNHNEKEGFKFNIDIDLVSSLHDSKDQPQKSIEFTERTGKIITKSQKDVRKTNLKSAAKVGTESPLMKKRQTSKAKLIFMTNEEQACAVSKYQQVLEKIQDFHKQNQNMKTNYEYLMGQYCRANEEQFSKIDQQLQEFKNKLSEIDILHTHFEKIKIQLENKINTFHKDTENKLNTKIDGKAFRQQIQETNSKITGAQEERKRLANKEETKRAIEFLQAKLNFLITEVIPEKNQKYPKLNLVELEISHLTSRFQALPISKKKTSLYPYTAVKKANELQTTARHATVQGFSSTKRQASSIHFKTRSEKMITEEKLESCSMHKQKNIEENSTTLRVKQPNERDNFSYLKDRSRQLLSKGEKPKQRSKLKKERIIFSYD